MWSMSTCPHIRNIDCGPDKPEARPPRPPRADPLPSGWRPRSWNTKGPPQSSRYTSVVVPDLHQPRLRFHVAPKPSGGVGSTASLPPSLVGNLTGHRNGIPGPPRPWRCLSTDSGATFLPGNVRKLPGNQSGSFSPFSGTPSAKCILWSPLNRPSVPPHRPLSRPRRFRGILRCGVERLTPVVWRAGHWWRVKAVGHDRISGHQGDHNQKRDRHPGRVLRPQGGGGDHGQHEGQERNHGLPLSGPASRVEALKLHLLPRLRVLC
jgi:hypothetical protein